MRAGGVSAATGAPVVRSSPCAQASWLQGDGSRAPGARLQRGRQREARVLVAGREVDLGEHGAVRSRQPVQHALLAARGSGRVRLACGRNSMLHWPAASRSGAGWRVRRTERLLLVHA